MNRPYYFNYVQEKLIVLAYGIEVRGKLNILDYHLHSENFYRDLLNLLYGWHLVNLNAAKQNVEAIDLVDTTNKIVVQVSSTATKQKIEAALGKDLSKYKGFGFKFMSISKDASALRTGSYTNPHNLAFAPAADIFDVGSLIARFLGLTIEDQRIVFEFIKKELGTNGDAEKTESNLATIIGILTKENLNDNYGSTSTIPYEVEKKLQFNGLQSARSSVEDYKIHYGRLDKIYSEFDKLGANKSASVLNAIRREYTDEESNCSSDALFFKVIDGVITRIETSTNYAPIPIEELELCVNILVVDAFIRCKIFKNPMT